MLNRAAALRLRWIVVCGLVAFALLGAAGTASASTTHDISGKWSCCGAGGAGAQIFDITSASLSSGSFSGNATYTNGTKFSPITGTVTGTSVTLTTGPYIGSTYSATFKGTISVDNNTMSGTWTSNVGQAGTWTATRTSGGGGGGGGGGSGTTFIIEPRITCAGICHVVLVKVTFDSAGLIVAENILPGQESSATVSKKKRKPLIKRLSTAVAAGVNTLKLKLTAAGQKKLNKNGKLRIKVRFTFTPTGGTASKQVKTFTVKLPKKN